MRMCIEHPEIKFISIHDSLLMPKSKSDLGVEFIKEEFNKLGVEVVVRVK
jgi:hypothetical protein